MMAGSPLLARLDEWNYNRHFANYSEEFGRYQQQQIVEGMRAEGIYYPGTEQLRQNVLGSAGRYFSSNFATLDALLKPIHLMEKLGIRLPVVSEFLEDKQTQGIQQLYSCMSGFVQYAKQAGSAARDNEIDLCWIRAFESAENYAEVLVNSIDFTPAIVQAAARYGLASKEHVDAGSKLAAASKKLIPAFVDQVFGDLK
ncbi:MAG: hypothetical protein HGA85_09365 [Nanoarchaeota archaeon]|nr:hypothetical protein [Nanoarchaeota archaeon]